MNTQLNPFAAPDEIAVNDGYRRPPEVTIAIVLLTCWGVLTTYLFVQFCLGGSVAIQILRHQYQLSRLHFFLVCSFLVFEPIGSWIGIYFLTGRRARTIPLFRACLLILGLGCLSACAMTLLVMAVLEVAVRT